MPKKIDDHRLEVFRDPEIADKTCEILESLEAMRHYVQILYGTEAVADVLTIISLDVMSAVLIATTDPEKYELVCKDICEILYKKIVVVKKARDAKEKG